MNTITCASLPLLTDQQRRALRDAPRTSAAHRDLMANTPAMNQIELGGGATMQKLPANVTIAAWNVERCLFPKASADHLRPFGVDIVLLSEMDKGMSRTGQAHTTADMAEMLGMCYAYGVEFFEEGLGDLSERQFCKDEFNAAGWHGNAILSKAPFKRVSLLRLDHDGHWFVQGEGSAAAPSQPRLGGRMALLAIVPTKGGDICVVSTHLESNADEAHRHEQFERILEHVETFAHGLPVLIGGDLNTGNHLPPDYDWKRETLFELARDKGYTWDLTAEGVTTRHSLITPHDHRRMKLDWFASRALNGEALPLLASLDPKGTPLSDHECILCRVNCAP